MGWSCRKDALDALKPLQDFCAATTGCSNTWKLANGREYFYEISHKEHDDGAITGSVVELGPPTGAPDGARPGYKVGSFRVDGDGKIARAPAVFKAALNGGKLPARVRQSRRGKRVDALVSEPVYLKKLGL